MNKLFFIILAIFMNNAFSQKDTIIIYKNRVNNIKLNSIPCRVKYGQFGLKVEKSGEFYSKIFRIGKYIEIIESRSSILEIFSHIFKITITYPCKSKTDKNIVIGVSMKDDVETKYGYPQIIRDNVSKYVDNGYYMDVVYYNKNMNEIHNLGFKNDSLDGKVISISIYGGDANIFRKIIYKLNRKVNRIFYKRPNNF